MRVAAGQELAGQRFGDSGPPRIVAGRRADLVVLDVGGRFVVRDRLWERMQGHVARGSEVAVIRTAA